MIAPNWELLAQVFTVESVMTPRENLLTWQSGADQAEVRSVAASFGFDLIPVESDGEIVGLLSPQQGFAIPLTREWLVSQDSSIPDLLNLLIECRRPGLLALHGQQVTGIVTPADLNKMPARHYVYNLLGELELKLAQQIRQHFAERFADSMQHLDSGRQKSIRNLARKQRDGNVHVDLIELMTLSDLLRIASSEPTLSDRLKIAASEASTGELKGLVALRNSVMHLVRPLIESSGALENLRERLRGATTLLQRLDEFADPAVPITADAS